MTDEPEYTLVMPFVTCQSNGGPHEDSAYVAGFEMGSLAAVMATYTTFRMGPIPEFETTIHAANQPQADLIAMKYGYVAEFAEIDDYPEYVHARFSEQGTGVD